MEKVKININLYCRNAFLIAFNGILLVALTIFLIYYSKLQIFSSSSVKVLNITCARPVEKTIIIDDATFFDLKLDLNHFTQKGDLIGVYDINQLKQNCIKLESILLRYILLYNIRYNKTITHNPVCLDQNNDIVKIYNNYQMLIGDINDIKLKKKAESENNQDSLVRLMHKLQLMREKVINNSSDIYNLSMKIDDNKKLVAHYLTLMQNYSLFNDACDDCVLSNVIKSDNKIELKLESNVFRCSFEFNKLDKKTISFLQSSKSVKVYDNKFDFAYLDYRIIDQKMDVIFYTSDYDKLISILKGVKNYDIIKFVN